MLIRKHFRIKTLLLLSYISCVLVGSSSFATEIIQQLSYDATGNLVSDGNFYHEYDSNNYLVRTRENTADGTVIVQYWYDEQGQRIKKVDFSQGESVTTYYPDQSFVREVDSSGSRDTVFYHKDKKLVGRKDPDGKLFFYHPDHLGSTFLVTNTEGSVVEETDYLPFGDVFYGGKSRYLFTGQERDTETGFHYYNARYYSSNFRHFIQPDSIVADCYDPRQLNRYSYAVNNPVNFVDPTGHYISPLDALDYASFVYSSYQLYKNPTWGNLGWFALDLAMVVTPGLGGAGSAGRGLKKGTKRLVLGDNLNSIAKNSNTLKKDMPNVLTTRYSGEGSFGGHFGDQYSYSNKHPYAVEKGEHATYLTANRNPEYDKQIGGYLKTNKIFEHPVFKDPDYLIFDHTTKFETLNGKIHSTHTHYLWEFGKFVEDVKK